MIYLFVRNDLIIADFKLSTGTTLHGGPLAEYFQSVYRKWIGSRTEMEITVK